MPAVSGVMVSTAEDWGAYKGDPSAWAAQVERHVEASESRLDEALACGCLGRWAVSVRGPIVEAETGRRVMMWLVEEVWDREKGAVPTSEVGDVIREGLMRVVEVTS